MLGQWKRPLFNKLISLLIALMYAGASLTSPQSIINGLIPLAIVLIQISVIVVATFSTISAIKDAREDHSEKDKQFDKEGPRLTL
jgi:4-hydroxybenzoate polyprenyltransferase